uniref:Uncharacterized protein n=1 Tax=Cacopsylla melanoneura TaxID=428564 RepID=A0A8D8R3L6_9HEMI
MFYEAFKVNSNVRFCCFVQGFVNASVELINFIVDSGPSSRYYGLTCCSAGCTVVFDCIWGCHIYVLWVSTFMFELSYIFFPSTLHCPLRRLLQITVRFMALVLDSCQ